MEGEGEQLGMGVTLESTVRSVSGVAIEHRRAACDGRVDIGESRLSCVKPGGEKNASGPEVPGAAASTRRSV